jgi:hypothetical protein
VTVHERGNIVVVRVRPAVRCGETVAFRRTLETTGTYACYLNLPCDSQYAACLPRVLDPPSAVGKALDSIAKAHRGAQRRPPYESDMTRRARTSNARCAAL